MFYVYELIDPRTSKVFYVGKGTGKRAWAHKNRSLLKHDSPKNSKIRSLLEDGIMYDVFMISEHNDENDAYTAEVARILPRH